MIVAIIILMLFVFLGSGIPIAITLATVGGLGIYLISGMDSVLGMFQSVPFRTVASYLLTTCPMFILMAEFASTGITQKLFDFMSRRTKRFPAALGIATVFASAVFGAICGSTTAAAATMSNIAIPEMVKKHYPPKMAVGIVAISGTLAIMIPPSITMVLYGILSDTSVGKLLIAGIIPGILSALAYSTVIIFWFKREQKKRNIPPDEVLMQLSDETKSNIKNAWQEISSILPVAFLIVLVLGGIYSGIITPTEAAAVGACATFIIGLLQKELTLRKIWEACKRAVKTTAMIFSIMIGARIFGYFLVFSRTTVAITDFVSSIPYGPVVVMAALVVFYIILGMFMDGIAILLLTVPVVAPIVSSLGLDLVWFGVICTKLIEIGLVTPPVGINVFIASDGAGVPVEEGFKGSAVMLLGEVVVLLLLLLVPALSLWLPNLSMS
ncbi:MAG: TRAP transporter large permease [Clostridiales bacterium]|nr:TRAP transporter large permease [Clostridiales bacterium]